METVEVMISIVIPLYNKATSIQKTLNSVFAQTYTDYEIVIVDDGSTDDSVAIVRSINDARIRLISQANGGVSVARNRGTAEAKGEYIAYLDADDVWSPNYLETQVDMINRYPQCCMYGVNYQICDYSGIIVPTIIRELSFTRVDGIMDNYFTVAAKSNAPLWTSAIVVRKSAIEAVGGFPVGIKSGEDLLTWARLACRGKIAFSKKVCATYNLGEGYDFANQPPRRQDAGDPVGRELKKLYEKYPSADLKRYIGHWHKMRASVAIRYFERCECFAEACKSIRYFPNKKILPFFIMPIVPKVVLKKLFRLHR